MALYPGMVEAGEPGAILEALPDVGCEVNLGQSDFEPRAVVGPTGSIVQTGYWGHPTSREPQLHRLDARSGQPRYTAP